MNIGITISYIVGGLLMISILTLNNNVRQQSYQHTVEFSTSTQVDELRRLIMHDMQYFAFGSDSDVLNFSDNHLRFQASVNGENQVISWELKNNGYNDTTNPSDRVLQRKGPMDNKPGSTVTKYPAVRFHIQAFMDEEAEIPATTKDEVRSVLIELVVESEEPVGSNPDGSAKYSRSGWKKLFLPDNIMI